MPVTGSAKFAQFAGNPQHGLLSGLRYYWQGKEFTLDWRTTFETLSRLPFISQAPHHPGKYWEVYRFEIPLHFGHLELPGAQINVPNERFFPDVPFDHIYIEVRLGDDGPDNYWQVKNYLLQSLGQPDPCWERDDQLHSAWESDGISVSLTYSFKSRYNQTESGAAALSFENNRIFPEYFTDEYVSAFRLDSTVYEIFEVPHAALPYTMSYRYFRGMKFRPEHLAAAFPGEKDALVVWYDAKQSKLGFAKPGEPFCVIMALNGSDKFTLQWVDLDRGAEQDEIQWVRPDGSVQKIVSAPVGKLDGVASFIERAGLSISWNNKNDVFSR